MMTRLSRLVLALALAAPPALALADAAAREQGAALLAPFKRDLQQALRDGLASGPEEAIAACRMKAPAIAAALSKDGARVGRASHRLRNPANAAPPWVAPVLDAYLADAADRAPRVVAIGDGRSGYVEPIVLQPMCVACHGATLAPNVAAKIEALYPDDRATGFAPGDLRGVFWAELPPPPAR